MCQLVCVYVCTEFMHSNERKISNIVIEEHTSHPDFVQIKPSIESLIEFTERREIASDVEDFEEEILQANKCPEAFKFDKN